MERKTALLIAFLAFLALVFSCLIILLHKDNAALQGICTAVEGDSCLKVQESPYAAFFGFDNAYIGIVGFFVLFALALIQAYRPERLVRKAIVAGCTLAGIAGLVFMAVQAFVIHAFCLYCTVVDLLSVAMMAVGLLVLKKGIRKGGK